MTEHALATLIQQFDDLLDTMVVEDIEYDHEYDHELDTTPEFDFA